MSEYDWKYFVLNNINMMCMCGKLLHNGWLTKIHNFE